jgi:hypothetical protein
MAYDKFAAVDSSTLLFPPSVRENLAGVSPNYIINGAFDINQRAFTSTTTSSAYGFDRWAMAGSGGTITYSAQTLTPGAIISNAESPNYARVVTSGQSTSGNWSSLYQRIENVRTLAGQTVNVSFWARAASGTPNIGVTFQQTFGTGGSSFVLVSPAVKAITTSWVRYSFTADIPSVSGKTIGADNYLQLYIFTSAGATLSGSGYAAVGVQNATIDVWGVQVEAGAVATPFRRNANSIQGELAACQRYYYRISGGFAHYLGLVRAHSTTAGNCMFTFKQTMRTVPVSLESASLELDNPGIGTISITATYGSLITGTDTASVSLTGSGLSTTATYYLRFSTTGHIAWSAEL